MNRIIIILLTFLFLSSCNNLRKESKTSENNYIIIDTVLNTHRTIISINNVALKNSVENEIQIKIKDIATEKIVIYTSTSEATVKVGKNAGEFLITPKLDADKVTITVNKQSIDGLEKLGKVCVTTTHNKS